MKRSYVIALAVLLVAAGVIVLLLSRKNDGQNMANMSTSSQASTSTNQKPVSTEKVSIANFAFSPATITVKAGTTVTWTNNDTVTHTVTADSGSGPDSGNLAPGKIYTFTFKTAGTYKYHCAIHASMTGTVIVTK